MLVLGRIPAPELGLWIDVEVGSRAGTEVRAVTSTEGSRLLPHRPNLGAHFGGAHKERPVPIGHRCVACGGVFADAEQRGPVCEECDRALDDELAAYLQFIAVCRGRPTATA